MTISIKEFQDKIRVSVRDTGKGIDQEVIDRLHKGEVSSKQIGLFNVHQRVKLIYGTDLVIHRLNSGTEVYFDIGKEPS
ncbi:Inner membrane protein ypdA [Mycobacteroides abscessus subsp. abscessus]|nr:Inner membrane protein ypdA [Mycobacteroides abscessus subsp. abscessus]